ncbi:MAG: RagB/SusD family nutrient uptake outer membrane protein [Bacteroidetes bacterium]|nr:RagB/SusD family nutrient uptake outer membrane protein [Bacteroidota bacterium]
MKKILFLTIIGFTLLLTSCNKVLDTKPLDKYTEDQVWGNASMAKGYMNTLYANVLGMYTDLSQECLTKNAQNQVWGGSYTSVKAEQIDRTYNAGWGQYGNIRSCNLAISKLTASKFVETDKNTMLGEAYFLRAMVNYYLVQRFGGIQLIDKVLTPDDNMYIPRASIKESYDFVLNDIKLAAEKLPASNERGRATKGAAYALAMRVALQGGAYLNDNSYYQQVISNGDLLFALNKYSLDSYFNLFNTFGSAVASNEQILILEQSKINTTFGGTPMQGLVTNVDNSLGKLSSAAMSKHPLVESFEGWCNYAPTQDLADDYLVTDADGKEKAWDQTSYVTTKKNIYQKIHSNRDLRFYSTFIYDSCMYFKNLAFTRADGNVTAPSLGGGATNGSTTGYWFRKYVYFDAKLWYADNTPYCYSILRLGEAYLNYAEAAIKLGNEAKAQQYITKTYQTHGGFSNSITSTGVDLWMAYTRERNVEMVLEGGDRYWSLLRWGMQKSGGAVNGSYVTAGFVIPELNGKMRAMSIDAQGVNFNVVSINEKGGSALVFTPKRYLFPVPYDQIQKNSKLVQNPGWTQ